jgi:hypothetical protein
VRVTLAGGKTIQFPASALQKHVDQFGVNGSFRIIFDDKHKMVSMERISN